MIEIDKYYQIFGLKQGASKEEVKQTYRDLVNVWHPDRFANNSRLQQKANEKLREINLAYKRLMEYMANPSYFFF
jgi:curved DNA-binding protein CbpA